MFNKHVIGSILWVEDTLLHNKGPGPDFVSSQPVGYHTVQCQPWYIWDLWMVVESKLLHLVSLFYFLLSPQFTITVTTSQRSPICLMLLACLSIYISLVVSLSCLSYSLSISPLLAPALTFSVASVGGWIVSSLFSFNLWLSSWSVSILTYIIPHYPSSCVSEFVFQDFSLFCFFFFSNFLWLLGLFSVCPCLNHTLPIYLTSGCLPVIIFLFVLLHPSVSVPHLSFSISILTFLFQSLSSPLPPQLPLERTFTFSVSVSHTYLSVGLLILFSLFDTLSYHPFSTSVTISLVGWLSCACLLPPSFCSYVCFICMLSCLQFPVCLYLSLTKMRAWSLVLDCLESNPSCVLTCKTAVPTSVLPRALNELTHVKFVELCLRQQGLKNISS